MCSEGFGCPELKKLCPPDCLQSKEQNQPKSPPSGTQITAVCTTCGIDDILQVPIRLPEVRHVMQLLLCKQSDCSGSRTQDQAEGRGDPYIQEGYLPIRIAGTKPSIFVRKLSYRQVLFFTKRCGRKKELAFLKHYCLYGLILRSLQSYLAGGGVDKIRY